MPTSIVLAKFLHYCIAVVFFTFLGFLINYYYAQTLFTSDAVSLSGVISAATLASIYFIFCIALVTLFSSLFKKGLIAGILVLSISFFTPTLMVIEAIKKFIPYTLLESANTLNLQGTGVTIAFVAIISIISVALAILRMNKVEVI